MKSLIEIIKPVVEEKGMDFYHVEMVKEGGEHYLRVYIDSEQGVNIDNCVVVSKAVSEVLDIEDPIDHSYYLEVSSPGIERELFTEEHYERYIGSEVKVKLKKLHEGNKKFNGIFKGYDSNTIKIESEGSEIEIPREKITVIRLKGEF